MREKSDESKSAWHSRKYVKTELNFFHIQFEVPRVKSRQLFQKKITWKGLSFYIYFGPFVSIWNFKWLKQAEKSLFWVKKKAANNFFYANHHFEPHKIGF